jgi:hypothetical protein
MNLDLYSLTDVSAEFHVILRSPNLSICLEEAVRAVSIWNVYIVASSSSKTDIFILVCAVSYKWRQLNISTQKKSGVSRHLDDDVTHIYISKSPIRFICH